MLRFRTSWFGAGPGLPYTSVMHWGDSDQAAADAGAAAINTFWGAVDAFIAVGCVWALDDEVEIVDPLTDKVTGVLNVDGGTGQGAATGDILPGQTQGLVRWRTGAFVNGRKVKGRTFIPQPTEAHNAVGLPLATYRDPIATAATTLANAGSAGSTLGVYSPTHGASYGVQAASVATQWAVLRSRRD